MPAAGVMESVEQLRQLLRRVEHMESRLPEIEGWSERRRQLEAGVWGKEGTPAYEEWKTALSAVDGFYGELKQAVEEARGHVQNLRGIFGEAGWTRIGKQLHPSSVKSVRRALEEALHLAEEYLGAQREERRARRRTTAPGTWRVGPARQGESARRNPALESAGRAEELQRRDRGSPLKGESKLQEDEFHAAPPGQPEPLCLGPSGVTGRWVTSREYAQRTGIALQTLANWRLADRRAGRAQPEPDKPYYRHFGKNVRYWLPESLEHPLGQNADGSPVLLGQK